MPTLPIISDFKKLKTIQQNILAEWCFLEDRFDIFLRLSLGYIVSLLNSFLVFYIVSKCKVVT
jgi:hypothetical protein